MRKLLIALTAAVLITTGAPAFADSPAGTADRGNDVDCGVADPSSPGVDTGRGLEVRSGGDATTGGAVVICSDDRPPGGIPVQGRIIASGSTEGGYVAVDGDRDNDDARTQGWTRVDVSAGGPIVRCGGAKGGGYDAANPIAGGSMANCLP